MEPTAEQQAAIDAALAWNANPRGATRFVLKGVAGSGKTSVQRMLLEALPSGVELLAPTGKAAVRLAQVTGQPARTVHSAIYTPWMTDNGDLRFTAKAKELGGLAIVDEASMVTGKMASDLEDAFDRVLYVGDPFQLPPVKSVDWFGQVPADATLTEVHRQAQDSPILRLATKIRLGGSITPADAVKGVLDIVSQRGIPWETVKAKIDQVICGTNKNRSMIIRLLRADLPQTPQVGERVVCLKNVDQGEVYAANGEQFIIESSEPLKLRVRSETGDIVEGPYWTNYFANHYTPTPPPVWDKGTAATLHFDFAHAITVHKAQGSQWDRVLFYDDFSYMRDPVERRRAQYTAVSRASQRLVIAI